ncbi:hypothetical protein C8R43DRAFT_1244182 [Mycena crocata]|nr:hypothetical protein C8R43DRAFT_1244182 [Mycena crocata]
MDDILRSHPELTPGVFKLVSNELTAAQTKITELERKLVEAESPQGTSTSQAEVDILILTCSLLLTAVKRARLGAELAELRVSYEQERDNGRKVQESLEARYIELRTKEADVQRSKQHIMEKMEAFVRTTETLANDAAIRASTLQAQLGAAMAAKAVLERNAEADREALSKKDDALSVLALAHQNLNEAFSEAGRHLVNATESGRQFQEAWNATHAELVSKTDSFKIYAASREAALVDVRTNLATANARLVTAESTHLRFEQDIRGLHAAKDNADVFRSQLEDKMRAVTAELGTLRNEYTAARKTHDVEKEILGAAVEAKEAQIHSLREETDTSITELEEKLRLTSAAVETADATIDQLKTKNSDLKKKLSQREQYATKVKEEAQKMVEGMQAQHAEIVEEKNQAVLDSDMVPPTSYLADYHAEFLNLKAYINLRDEYMAQNTEHTRVTNELTAREDEVAKLRAKFETIGEENRELEDANKKLKETTKNLQLSVLRAGVEAREELQKAGGDEQTKLEQALADLRVNFLKVEAERNDLANKLRFLLFNPSWDEVQASLLSLRRQAGLFSGGDDKPIQPERTPAEERTVYNEFMGQFPWPPQRKPFRCLVPVGQIGRNPLEPFKHDFPSERPILHCPKRTLWCGPSSAHALVFAPTREYDAEDHKWVNHTRMTDLCGLTVDLFVSQSGAVYYAGIYKLQSLRAIHAQGSWKRPVDVSAAAILQAMGLGPQAWDKLRECFPDGGLRTECFGLQCVGFDSKLYQSLREASELEGGKLKRKAGVDELRDGRAKLQKCGPK